ncbi:MAG: hypothetical protein ACK55Z_08485, partial [bacterium]
PNQARVTWKPTASFKNVKDDPLLYILFGGGSKKKNFPEAFVLEGQRLSTYGTLNALKINHQLKLVV